MVCSSTSYTLDVGQVRAMVASPQVATVLQALMTWRQADARVSTASRKAPIGALQVNLEDLIMSPESVPRPVAGNSSRPIGGPESPRHPLHWMLGGALASVRQKGSSRSLSSIVQQLSPSVELSDTGVSAATGSGSAGGSILVADMWTDWLK